MPWEASVFGQLAAAHEITIVVPAPDRKPVSVPVWIVAVGSELYVRSWKGEAGVWYRRARRHGTGSITLAGDSYDVRFTPTVDLEAEVDQQFLAKYAASPYARAMTEAPAAGTTLRLDPA